MLFDSDARMYMPGSYPDENYDHGNVPEKILTGVLHGLILFLGI